MKGLTDIAGLRVGHATNFEAMRGSTVVICESGAVAGVDVRGSASGNAELETLRPRHVTDRIHGVVLTGGSAFGLEAASGVRRYLEARGIGFRMGSAVVPIVPCAVIYDLGIGQAGVRPTREMGEAAAAAATTEPVMEGNIGAGAGATVGKLFGLKQAMKGGLGSATVSLPGGVLVSALVVVNAFGDVRDFESGKLIAGARRAPDSRDLADTEAEMKRGARGGASRSNTTLAVVATNAQLGKVQATKLAEMAHVGLARTIYPVSTMYDGDTVFALSAGPLQADLNTLGVAAAEALARSVVRAVQKAGDLGGVPGLAGRG